MNLKLKSDFKDYQKNLFSKGFVHIPKAFSPDSIKEVRESIDSLFSEANNQSIARHASSLEEKPESIVEINHVLKSSVSLKSSKLVTEAKILASSLLGRKAFCAFDHAIYKPPSSGKISWHQDEAYKASVKKMSSIHFWIPLHPVSPEEGGMQYIPLGKCSERLKHRKHSTSHTLFAEPSEESLKYAESCSTDIGDVVIHTPSTLHSSLPNKSEKTRKAWIVHFNPFGPYEVLLPQNILPFVRSRLFGS